MTYERYETECCVCGSDYESETHPDTDNCFLIPLPHCVAAKAPVCAYCIRTIRDAAEDLEAEGLLEEE